MRAGSSTRQKGAVPVPEKEITAVVHCLRTWRHYEPGSAPGLYYIGNLKEKIPQLIVQLAEASREQELERKKKELADETVRRDEMIKSASRFIKNAVERKKEQELFLRIAESKASRLTEVFHSLVSQLRE